MANKIGTPGLVQHSDKFNCIYRGTVMDNIDPNKTGRIKIKVYPMFSKVETINIPWAIPAMALTVGAGIGYGNFSVPDIDTNVWVFFEQGDIYQPVYFAEAQDAIKGIPTDTIDDYPETSVFETKTGIQIKINRKAGNEDIKISHPSGASFEILPDGNIILTTVKESANVTIISGSGNVNITAASSLNIDAPETIVGGNLRVNTGDNGTFTDNAGKVITVDGGIITGGLS